MAKKKGQKETAGSTQQAASRKKLQTLAIVVVVVALSVAAGIFFSGKGVSYPAAFGGEGRQTMSPDYFIGKTARSYQVAREIPQVLDKIYCYCKCQENHGHKSLLTCFVDRHSSQCGVCMDEALMAHDLYKKGYSTEKIVNEVNARFSGTLKHS